MENEIVTPLAAWLAKTGTRVDEMADAIGIHRVSLYAARAGRSMPRPATIRKITLFTKGKVGATEIAAGWEAYHKARK